MSDAPYTLNIPAITHSKWPSRANISIVRGDLLHPVVSGNKLFKLLPFIQSIQGKSRTLISVGGRYSNHLHALAWVGQSLGIKTVGIVQGYSNQPMTPTLKDCTHWGMTIHYVDRETYRLRYLPSFWDKWSSLYPDPLCIYEGGWSDEAIYGSRLWWEGITHDTTMVICAVGSGCTLAGLCLSAPDRVTVVGVPVFKDPNNYAELRKKLSAKGVTSSQYCLWDEFSGLGFGKLDEDQRQFGQKFTLDTGIMLDPVYTTKVFYALHMKLAFNPALSDKAIAILHTGGLQGCRT